MNLYEITVSICTARFPQDTCVHDLRAYRISCACARKAILTLSMRLIG